MKPVCKIWRKKKRIFYDSRNEVLFKYNVETISDFPSTLDIFLSFLFLLFLLEEKLEKPK